MTKRMCSGQKKKKKKKKQVINHDEGTYSLSQVYDQLIS